MWGRETSSERMCARRHPALLILSTSSTICSVLLAAKGPLIFKAFHLTIPLYDNPKTNNLINLLIHFEFQASARLEAVSGVCSQADATLSPSKGTAVRLSPSSPGEVKGTPVALTPPHPSTSIPLLHSPSSPLSALSAGGGGTWTTQTPLDFVSEVHRRLLITSLCADGFLHRRPPSSSHSQCQSICRTGGRGWEGSGGVGECPS